MNLRPFQPKTTRKDGFTLIELLVVVVTLGILAVLLLPAIAGTKPNTQAFQCMQNQRQLTLGWQMYAVDNSDLLPPNDYPFLTSYATAGPNQSKMKNWVVGTMANTLDAQDFPYLTGGVSELLDPNTLLSPYIKNRASYHCPADNYVDPYAGNRVHVRSYSMNSAVGTFYFSSIEMGGNSNRHIGTAVSGGWLPGNYNNSQTTWLTYGKMSSFTAPRPSYPNISSFTPPGPADTWVFIDENPRTINDGSMAVSARATSGNTYLIDYPSANHNRAACISFADGHVAIHEWQDKRTYTVSINGQGNVIQASSRQSPDNPDCFFLAPLTSALR